MATLFNTKISATYPGLLKTIDNAALSATLRELTDGAGNLSGLFLNTAGDFKVTNILEWGSLKDTGTGVTITQWVTAANGIENFDNDTTVPTSAAVKLYVDTKFATSDTLTEVLAFGNTTSGYDIVVSANDNITFTDSSKAIFGTGQDLEVNHDGFDSFITDLGTGNLRLRSDDSVRIQASTGGNTLATFTKGAGVDLYFSNAKKIETLIDGAKVTGNVVVTGTVTGVTFLGDLNGTINTLTTAVTQTAGNNSTKVATTAYVDVLDAASDLDFSGDSGTGDVNLNTEVFAITGTTNQIITAANLTGLSLSLPATVHRDLQGNVTGNVDGDLTGNVTATSVLVDGVTATTQASSDSSTKVATTAYVKGLDNASDLDITGDTGTGDVNLNTQTLNILGTTNEITTAVVGQTATISLPSSISVDVIGNVTGDLTGNADTSTKIASITNSDIVQLTTTQTLTNKTLTSPTITGTGAIAGVFTGNITGDVLGDVTGNLTGTVTGTSILADGVIATTQAASNNSTKVATTAYADAAATAVPIGNYLELAGGIMTGDTIHNDSVKSIYGTASDGLEIYHDGLNSYINETGTGDLYIRGTDNIYIQDTSTTERFITCNSNASVDIFYNDSLKLATTNTGISVTGNGAFTGNVTLTDAGQLQLGTGNDGQVYHDGSNLYLNNSTGQLNINQSAVTESIVFKTSDANALDVTALTISRSGDLTTGRNVTIAGDLTVNGTTTTVNSQTLAVVDPLIQLAKGNTANSLDIGFYGDYDDAGTDRFLGLFSDASDGNKFKLFKGTTVEPTTTVNIGGAGYVLADLQVAGFEATTISTTGTATIGNTLYVTEYIQHLGNTSNNIRFTTDAIAISANATFSGNVNLADNKKIKFGAGEDLELYSDGTDGYVVATVDDLVLRSADDVFIEVNSGANSIIAKGGGAVELYYNNVKNLETTASGINTTGIMEITSSGVGVIGAVGNTANDVNIYSTTAGHNGLRMHSNGILPTDNTGTIIDNDADLGDVSYRFKDLYLGGSIISSGAAGFTGDITISKTYPKLILNDTQGVQRNFSVGVDNETFTVRNETLTSDAFQITGSTNAAVFAGSLTAGIAVFNSASTNVVAEFQSSDTQASIKLVDSGGNVEIGAAGDTFTVQPAGSVAALSVSSSLTSLNTQLDIKQSRSTYVTNAEDDSATAHIFTTDAQVGDFSQLAGSLVLQARVNDAIYRDIILAGGLGTVANPVVPILTVKGEGTVQIDGSFIVTEGSTFTNIITVDIDDISTGENRGVRLINSNGTAMQWNITPGVTGVNNDDFCIRNSTDNINSLIIARNSNATFEGNVIIGATADTSAKLNIEANGETTYFARFKSTQGTGVTYGFKTNGTNSDVLAIMNVSSGNRMISIGENEFGVNIAGVNKFFIDSGGNVKLAITNATSNTIIGKDATGMYMETAGSTDALSNMRFQARASGAGNYCAIAIKPSTQTLEFKTSNAVRMIIQNTGLVDIINSYPYSLKFSNQSAYNSGINNGIVFNGIYTAGGSITDMASIRGGKENTVDTHYGGKLSFFTRQNGLSDSEKMRVDSVGNVGIGRTSIQQPTAGATTLAIQGTTTTSGGALRLYSSNDSVSAYIFLDNASGLSINTATSHPIVFRTAAAARLKIDATGFIYNQGNGTNNVSFGSGAGNVANITGAKNTFLGALAGDTVVSGYENIGIGYNALEGVATGSGGIAIGIEAGNFTSGNGNIAVGYGANGSGAVTGSRNISIGDATGYNVTSGGNNILIGTNAGRSGFQTPQSLGSVTTNSNEIQMGNTSHTGAYIQIAWTTVSDARNKTNFKEIPLGLDFVSQLKPTSFEFKKERESNEADGIERYGFLAQDILELEGDKPVIVNNNDKENLKYTSDHLIPVLVKAIQELTAKVEKLESLTCKCKN